MKRGKITLGASLISMAFSFALILGVKYQSTNMLESNHTLDNIMALSQSESFTGKGNCIYNSVSTVTNTKQQFFHQSGGSDSLVTTTVVTQYCNGIGLVCGICGVIDASAKFYVVTCNNYCKP